MTKESKAYKSGEYDDLFTAASTRDLTMEEAVAYSASYYKELDNRSAIRFAAKTNYDKGVEKGIEKGREEGIAIGIKKEKLTMAANMKASGMSIEQISGFTGLSIDEIESL